MRASRRGRLRSPASPPSRWPSAGLRASTEPPDALRQSGVTPRSTRSISSSVETLTMPFRRVLMKARAWESVVAMIAARLSARGLGSVRAVRVVLTTWQP